MRSVATGVAANANLCPGDSGGPLFLDGELVGINASTDFRFEGSFLERIDDHLPWLVGLSVVNVPQPAAMLTVHRSGNAAIHDHLQGLTQGEITRLAVRVSRVLTWREGGPNRRELFRCRYWGDDHHFLSAARDCEGTSSKAAWASSARSRSPEPPRSIVATWHPGRDHLTTTDANECLAAGFVVEHLQGYAPLN